MRQDQTVAQKTDHPSLSGSCAVAVTSIERRLGVGAVGCSSPTTHTRGDQDPSGYREFIGEARRRVVASIVERRSGHLCSSLSALDLVCTVTRREWDPHDRSLRADIVLSKGHAAPAFYAAMGLLDSDLPHIHGALRRFGTPYEGHPSRSSLRHIPVSTGSLGLGLAWSVGRAIGLEREASSRRVIVIVSDGELQEGLSFEALHLAARVRPKLLTVLVDFNGWQTDGPIGYDPAALLRGIGVPTRIVQGHDTDEISNALIASEYTGPVAIVARTKRCAGLPEKYQSVPRFTVNESLTRTRELCSLPWGARRMPND